MNEETPCLSALEHFPLIPLDDAVVLPNMALAVSISTSEARAAIDDALSGETPAQVVLVTRTDGRFARIGTVAELDGHPACFPVAYAA